MPRKLCSGWPAAAVARNSPLPLPISTSSGASLSNRALASQGRGKSSSVLKCRERSSAGSTWRRDRRPISALLGLKGFDRQRDALDLALAHQIVADEALEAADDHRFAAHSDQLADDYEPVAGADDVAKTDFFQAAQAEQVGAQQVVLL